MAKHGAIYSICGHDDPSSYNYITIISGLHSSHILILESKITNITYVDTFLNESSILDTPPSTVNAVTRVSGVEPRNHAHVVDQTGQI